MMPVLGSSKNKRRQLSVVGWQLAVKEKVSVPVSVSVGED
jgi:hypothetical protein